MLLNKKSYDYNGSVYYLDVDKVFNVHVSGKDYYNYVVRIYNKRLRYIPILKIPYIKYDLVNEYESYWLDYYDYFGNINLVIEKAFKITQCMFNDEKAIREIEGRSLLSK